MKKEAIIGYSLNKTNPVRAGRMRKYATRRYSRSSIDSEA
jgi:hypothetical protein